MYHVVLLESSSPSFYFSLFFEQLILPALIRHAQNIRGKQSGYIHLSSYSSTAFIVM